MRGMPYGELPYGKLPYVFVTFFIGLTLTTAGLSFSAKTRKSVPPTGETSGLAIFFFSVQSF